MLQWPGGTGLQTSWRVEGWPRFFSLCFLDARHLAAPLHLDSFFNMLESKYMYKNVRFGSLSC